ncbi:MAG: hypothetical protein GNW80_15400 [Asgard group archaeon]|nr:hypothetical protein [Asgard group archaeon]
MKKHFLVLTLIVFMINAFIADYQAINVSTSTIKQFEAVNNLKAENSSQMVADNCALIGNWDMNYGSPHNIIINDTLAYIIVYNAGLVVVNISNPSSPEVIGYCLFEGFVFRGFYIKDHYAILTNSDFGLMIIDISDPKNITILANYTGIGVGGAFEAFNDLAITTANSQFTILNISNPETPVELNQTNQALISHIALTDKYSFFTTRTTDTIEIYNITNPSTPDYITGFYDGHYLLDIYVEGDYLYYSSTPALTIMNISNIESPVFIANISAGGGAHDIKKIGDYLYLASNFGLKIINISNIHSPELVGSYNGDYLSNFIDVQQNIACITEFDFGVEIININNPSSPVKIGEFNFGGYTSDVQVNDDLAFVANDGWLAVLNLTDKTNPVQISRYPNHNRETYYCLAKSGDYAYIGSYSVSQLAVISLSDLENPTQVLNLWGAGFISDIVVKGDLAFLATADDGLVIYNISNPANPAFVSSFDNGGGIVNIEVKGNYVYAADRTDGLEIINITDIEHPTLIETYLGYAQDVVIAENYVIIATNRLLNAIVIEEMVSETELVKLSQFDYEGEVQGIFAEEDLIYIADGWNGLRILNWSNPSQPRLVGEYREESNAEKVCAKDGYIYLSYGLNGLSIVIFDANNNGIPDVLEKPEPPSPTPSSQSGIAFPVVFAALTVNLIVITAVRKRRK